MEIPTGVDVREARLRRWMEGIDVARLRFGMSLLLLAFVYGVATAKFRLWPMAQLSEARQAFQALTRVENDSLMQGILETLVPARPAVPTGILKFGEYRHFDGPMSTVEDYAAAEWRPTERELNGE